MKRLPVFLLLLGLVGCNYPSKKEAREACEKWKSEAEEIVINYKESYRQYNYYADIPPKTKTREITRNLSNRDCKFEEETNQFLGNEGKWDSKAKGMNGKHLGLIDEYEVELPKAKDWKVVKHFRY